MNSSLKYFNPNELINLALESYVEVEGLSHVKLTGKPFYTKHYEDISPLTRSNAYGGNPNNNTYSSKLTGNKIPLYMAIHLSKLNKVKIILSDNNNKIENNINRSNFFNDNMLDSIFISEKNSTEFTQLPSEVFFELSKILKIKNHKIEQIRIIRKNKLFKGLASLNSTGDGEDGGNSSLLINNLTRWEFNEVKEFMLPMIGYGNRISKLVEESVNERN